MMLTVTFGTGCGTLTRNDVKRGHSMYPHSSIYPATYVDIWGSQSPAAPLFLLDLPISLVTDTLLLPYDLLTKK